MVVGDLALEHRSLGFITQRLPRRETVQQLLLSATK
jgi:hypothetical protein